MQTVDSVQAFYPHFAIGCRPQAVECELRLVEANGRKYVRTPFAMLDAHGEDDHRRLLVRGPYSQGGFFATSEECEAYLRQQYPHWELAEPIMEAWFNSRQRSGVGDSLAADKAGCGTFDIAELSRGHKRFTRKQVREAAARCK